MQATSRVGEFLRTENNEILRDVAWLLVKSRADWWVANFKTVYLDEDEKIRAVEWMILEGYRSYRHPRHRGAFIDTMLDTLSVYEWMRWGTFPRRYHRFQRHCPWGENWGSGEINLRNGREVWPFPQPKPNDDNAHYSPRVEYDPLPVDFDDPVRNDRLNWS